MKKTIFLMGYALILVFMLSCSNDQFDDVMAEELPDTLQSANNNIMEFASKEDFKMLLEKGFAEGTRAGANYRIPSKFISLKDVISPSADILKEMSEEERNYVIQNKLTYYDVLGYEDIIPNEDFAKMVNLEGELILQDSLYRITDMATFVTIKEDAQELNEYLACVDAGELCTMLEEAPEHEVQLTPKIRAIKRFVNETEEQIIIDDDGRITGGGGGGTGNGPTNGAKGDNSDENILNQIPFSSFPTFSSSSHTFAGKIFDKILGERHSRRHEFRKDYRVSGSLYDYNYGFYRECGAYVSMDKKRGGFFKFINGWKDYDAHKLVLHIDHVVLETKIDISNKVLSTTPNSPVVLGTNNNGTSVEVCLFGKEWTIKDVEQYFGQGIKEAIKMLKSATSSNIPDNTRTFLFVTPQKLYKVIYNQTYQANHQHKVRKVFSSGISFVLSFNSSSWDKTLMQSIQETMRSPSYHIVDGQVKLAGKLDNDWGGMIINK